MSRKVSLYEAKTHLSALVEQAASGEEIIIAKNGEPRARLVPCLARPKQRKPANALKIKYIATDFDAPDPETEKLFAGGE